MDELDDHPNSPLPSNPSTLHNSSGRTFLPAPLLARLRTARLPI
jgi:hypothetical protein